jgi:hypothetical protein
MSTPLRSLWLLCCCWAKAHRRIVCRRIKLSTRSSLRLCNASEPSELNSELGRGKLFSRQENPHPANSDHASAWYPTLSHSTWGHGPQDGRMHHRRRLPQAHLAGECGRGGRGCRARHAPASCGGAAHLHSRAEPVLRSGDRACQPPRRSRVRRAVSAGPARIRLAVKLAGLGCMCVSMGSNSDGVKPFFFFCLGLNV